MEDILDELRSLNIRIVETRRASKKVLTLLADTLRSASKVNSCVFSLLRKVREVVLMRYGYLLLLNDSLASGVFRYPFPPHGLTEVELVVDRGEELFNKILNMIHKSGIFFRVKPTMFVIAFTKFGDYMSIYEKLTLREAIEIARKRSDYDKVLKRHLLPIKLTLTYLTARRLYMMLGDYDEDLLRTILALEASIL